MFSVKFREEALMDCTTEEKAGIFMLTDRVRNICFVQGLYTDGIRQSSAVDQRQFSRNSQNGLGGSKCYYLQTGKVQGRKRISP